MSSGKIYLGDILASDPDAGGSTVEYVTFTFNGGNTFKFCGLTDQGYLDDYTINDSGTLNVVKNSICFIGKMNISLNTYTTPSSLTIPKMTCRGTSYNVGAGTLYGAFHGNSASTSCIADPQTLWYHMETVIATTDITFYADVD